MFPTSFRRSQPKKYAIPSDFSKGSEGDKEVEEDSQRVSAIPSRPAAHASDGNPSTATRPRRWWQGSDGRSPVHCMRRLNKHLHPHETRIQCLADPPLLHTTTCLTSSWGKAHSLPAHCNTGKAGAECPRGRDLRRRGVPPRNPGADPEPVRTTTRQTAPQLRVLSPGTSQSSQPVS
jgi:hypothetical protein